MRRLRLSTCAAPGIARRRRGRGFEYRDPAGSASRTRRCWSESPSWRSRRPGARCGSAWTRSGTCRPPGSTRPDASSTATTTLARAPRPRRSSRRCSPSRERCRGCAGAWQGSGCDGGALADGARDACWPARCACSTSASSASAPRTTPSSNGSYGLATMLRAHVDLDGDGSSSTTPQSPGSAGCSRSPTRALAVIAALKRRRGGDAAARLSRRARWVEIPPSEINDYIKQRTRRRLQRQGLPHLERDRARRGGARAPRGRGDASRASAASSGGGQDASPPISATRPRSAAPPTSTRGCSTATTRGDDRRPAAPDLRPTSPTRASARASRRGAGAAGGRRVAAGDRRCPSRACRPQRRASRRPLSLSGGV